MRIIMIYSYLNLQFLFECLIFIIIVVLSQEAYIETYLQRKKSG